MNPTTFPYNTKSIKKFDLLTLTYTGLILAPKKQEAASILFSEIEKIYIKKCKLDLKRKLGILSFLLLLLFSSVVFLPIEMVLMSLILYIPILVWMQNYKSYRLELLGRSNTIYFKNFYRDDKQEHIDLVNAIRKEIFDNQINSPKAFKAVVKPESEEIQDYSFQSLSIA